MKKSKTLLIALSMLFVFASAASADQILDFEGFADLTVLTTQYAGINFQGATILSLGGSLNPQFPPKSGTNVIYNPIGAMELVFNTAIDYFSGYVTYNSGMTIEVFDVSNTSLGSVTGAYASNFIGSGNPENEYLYIAAANITKVVLTGGGGNNFTLDDVQFTGSISVPEPATMLLLGLGLCGIAGLKRRFR